MITRLIALLLFVCITMNGAIYPVAGQNAGRLPSSGTAFPDATFTNNVTNGNYVVVIYIGLRVSADPIFNTPTKVSGTSTIGSFVLDASYSNTSGTNNYKISVYRAPVTGTGTLTIGQSGTWADAFSALGIINEYSGMHADLDGTAATNTASSTTESTGSVTTTTPGMVLMVSTQNILANFTYTLTGNSVYQNSSAGSNLGGQVSHRLTNAGTHTLTATRTGASAFWIAVGVPYKSSDTTPQINYYNSASTPADGGTQAGPGAISITPPGDMTSGDLVFIHGLYNAATVTLTISNAGGQTWTSETNRQGSGVTSRLFWCVFNGTWSANPSVTNTTGTLALTAVMHVFRPITSTDNWTVDQAETGATYTAPTTPFTVTRTGQTTTQANTVSLAIWASFDDNTWGSPSGTGWNIAGTAQYRNLSGTDHSASYAYKVQTSAAATGDVSKNQATLGGDAGITHIISMYESAGGATPTHPGWLSVYGWK